MILHCTHQTTYQYRYEAFDSFNELRLMPLSDVNQTCLEFTVATLPNAKLYDYEEFGGRVHHFQAKRPHLKLDILATSTVSTHTGNPFEGLNMMEPDWDAYRTDQFRDRHIEFLLPSHYVPQIADSRHFAERLIEESATVANFLLRLNTVIRREFAYDPDATHVHSKIDDVFEQKAGVCQDFAHVMIACCRSVGIPARYVSGYLYLGSWSQLRGTQATHAWIEAMLPDGFWLSLDPTNDLLANDHYVRVHVGRDYDDVTPVRGIYTGVPAEYLDVSVTVAEIASHDVEPSQTIKA